MKRFLILAAFIVVFAISCSKLNCEVYVPETFNEEYLELSSYDSPHLLSLYDMRVLDDALKRFGFFEDNHKLAFKATCPESINISPKLYSYITSLVKKGNDPLTKSSQPTDCVARSLAMWGDYTYSDINSYIQSHYGNDGVPSASVFDVIRHFYPSATQCAPDSLSADYVPSIMTTMGFFETGDIGNAHMVNISSIDTVGVATYLDMQNNSIGELPLLNFSMIYMK